MKCSKFLTAVCFAAAASAAQSSALVPAFDTFGNLAGATFGGTGIPTDPTAITNISFEGATITLGITAFGRYCNGALSNNGAGVFTATNGVNDGACPGSPHALGTTWGFGYYIDLGALNFGRVSVDLLYDLDPGAGTDESAMGRLDFDQALSIVGGVVPSTRNHLEDSQNLYFGFFGVDALPVVDAPASAPFNPFAAGEYALALRVSVDNGVNGIQELGRAAILVDVIPEPGVAALAGLALLGAAGVMRRRQRTLAG